MTILNQLKTLSDHISIELDNLDYVDTSARVFLNHLPIEIAIDYFTEEEITSAGLQCGTKYTTPVRGGIECRKIPPSKKRLASNTSSLYLATNSDPVFYKENNKLFVLPTPNAEYEAYVSKIPNDFIPSNATTALEEIPNVPENSYHIILLYAGHLILYKKARDTRGLIDTYLSNLSFDLIDRTVDFSGITDIVDNLATDVSDIDLAFDASDLSSLDLNIDLSADFTAMDLDIDDPAFDLAIDLSSNPPTLDLSGITVPTVDLTDAISAINKASDFIGELTTDAGTGDVTSTEVPTGAFWLDDEDPEMVQSASQLAAQEINKGSSLANAQISTLQAYQAEINAKISEFRGKVEAFTSTNSLKSEELNAKLSLYKSKIESKATEINARSTVINAKLSELQSKIEKVVSKLQLELQARNAKNQTILQREQLSIAQFSARIQNYSAKLSKVVQKEQLELQNWQAKLQKEAQENQLEVQKYQMTSQNYVNIIQESQSLYQKYMNELQMFLGVANES